MNSSRSARSTILRSTSPRVSASIGPVCAIAQPAAPAACGVTDWPAEAPGTIPVQWLRDVSRQAWSRCSPSSSRTSRRRPQTRRRRSTRWSRRRTSRSRSSARRSTTLLSTRPSSRPTAPPAPPRRWPPRPPIPGASSPTTCAGTSRTGAPATSASTTGPPTVMGSFGRSCSPRATAPRSRATCGRPWRGRQNGPGIVITNGSVQADENMYWYAAQTLAKAGYVVLTFDPQGQGQSGHVRAVPRPERGRPGADHGDAVLRRHRGRDRLPALDPPPAV